MTEAGSILIIKMSALGDIVHALPTLHALRTQRPEAAIHWAVEPRFADILPGPPWLDSKILFDKASLKGPDLPGGLWRLRRELRRAGPAVSVDLQGLLKSSLVAVLSGAPDKRGYC